MSEILQFGTGRFLRGFFDCLVSRPASIVVVQSRHDSSGARIINENRSGYHVWTRGKLQGAVVDEFETVHSLDRALVAHQDWPAILDLALQPQLKLVVSNTTERGLALDTADAGDFDPESGCPVSYPAKLLSVLYHRFSNGRCGLTILPMELVENNARQLLSLVKQQARLWRATCQHEFLEWLEAENRWLSNLVDRIVVGVTESPPWKGEDPLAVIAEPFRMLAIADDDGDRGVIPDHPMVEWVDDLNPLFIRKVRILNGLHTAMVAHALPAGFVTVLDVMNDRKERAWLESLLHDEILPAMNAKDVACLDFAQSVLERFENPFFEHRLADIANGHPKKLITRIAPTIDDFRQAFGKEPDKLNSVLNAQV